MGVWVYVCVFICVCVVRCTCVLPCFHCVQRATNHKVVASLQQCLTHSVGQQQQRMQREVHCVAEQRTEDPGNYADF